MARVLMVYQSERANFEKCASKYICNDFYKIKVFNFTFFCGIATHQNIFVEEVKKILFLDIIEDLG